MQREQLQYRYGIDVMVQIHLYNLVALGSVFGRLELAVRSGKVALTR